jgi:hypothetical protein
MMEIIEDAVLGQVAIERLADIEGGLKTVPVAVILYYSEYLRLKQLEQDRID